MIANRITNPTELSLGSHKKISSVVSFNDGSSWTYLKTPLDSKGVKINCSSNVLFKLLSQIEFCRNVLFIYIVILILPKWEWVECLIQLQKTQDLLLELEMLVILY